MTITRKGSNTFARNSLRKEKLQIFNNMFTALGINHTHNIHAATNHLLGIPQKQTTHYGTYFITSTASVTWNNLLRTQIQTF